MCLHSVCTQIQQIVSLYVLLIDMSRMYPAFHPMTSIYPSIHPDTWMDGCITGRIIFFSLMRQNLHCTIYINVLYKLNWITLIFVQPLQHSSCVTRCARVGVTWLGNRMGSGSKTCVVVNKNLNWSQLQFEVEIETKSGKICRCRTTEGLIANEWETLWFCHSARFSSQFPNRLQSLQSICGTIFAHGVSQIIK